jgi:predicted nuclease of restriction endonuclease-like (RecB) superfamily
MEREMTRIADQKTYAQLLNSVKDRIRKAQYDALKAVNKELIDLYGDIGRIIVERQEKEGWGKSVVEKLAADLQKEFPGIQGFSAQNLWRMKQFYQAYAGNVKLSPLVREIGWTHNIIILQCKDDLQREFYIRMTRKMGWTKNVLMHHVENQTYEKTLLNQTNFDKALPEKIKNQAKLAVKDEYTFDFLELGDEHSEIELERSLMNNINRFLVEMGGTFTFAGNQFRLEIDGNEFFIDILLYHRRLKCLVAIELKAGKFLPEYVGKMQFYLTALDETIKEKSENPSIGIILCKDKNQTIVEYALRQSRKPIGVAKYQIVSKLPVALRKELPAPEQIAKLMDDIK